jgi:GNAT superfamily N-acetyltransferase
MNVRAATVEDVVAMAGAAAAQPLMKRYGATAESLERLLRVALDNGDGVLVASGDGGRGFAWYQQHSGFELGGYLKLIALAPGSEGKGLGGALLDEVERNVAVQHKHLFLMVSDFNHPAQRFYERKGYSKVGRLPALVRPDIDELLYVKRVVPFER